MFYGDETAFSTRASLAKFDLRFPEEKRFKQLFGLWLKDTQTAALAWKRSLGTKGRTTCRLGVPLT